MTLLNRRRFLTITAAAFAVPAGAAAPAARWRGSALGAPASLTIAGMTAAEAAPLFAAVEAELSRLEDIFSLYRPQSEISRLNAAGRLTAPSPELLQVLSLCGSLHEASGGAFDPTVQSLWTGGAPAAGWRSVSVSPAEVRLTGKDAALTLNGIAQGAVTDRIAALLRSHGLRDVLVDMGEVAALGSRAPGQPWRAGIGAPDGRIFERLTLSDRTLATSAPFAPLYAGQTGRSHILPPDSSHRLRQQLVAVSAPAAAVADGLSTALCLLDEDAIQSALNRFTGARLEARQTLG